MFSYGFFLSRATNLHRQHSSCVFLAPGGGWVAFVALAVAHLWLQSWFLGFDMLKGESFSVQGCVTTTGLFFFLLWTVMYLKKLPSPIVVYIFLAVQVCKYILGGEKKKTKRKKRKRKKKESNKHCNILYKEKNTGNKGNFIEAFSHQNVLCR